VACLPIESTTPVWCSTRSTSCHPLTCMCILYCSLSCRLTETLATSGNSLLIADSALVLVRQPRDKSRASLSILLILISLIYFSRAELLQNCSRIFTCPVATMPHLVHLFKWWYILRQCLTSFYSPMTRPPLKRGYMKHGKRADSSTPTNA